ncbi:uncharacterized protein LOC115630757 [Scaptodrosophila lebanonensis]|uniref:Uncharacterized protein LOC115630757 n=1 Tax=Drosophila lebanonensis TaxID=7225 RepID=A0A6J2U7Y4_DROLE|nr:uncharacterized protein LOC115630757 [Scaptodrosophila lebanonensis]
MAKISRRVSSSAATPSTATTTTTTATTSQQSYQSLERTSANSHSQNYAREGHVEDAVVATKHSQSRITRALATTPHNHGHSIEDSRSAAALRLAGHSAPGGGRESRSASTSASSTPATFSRANYSTAAFNETRSVSTGGAIAASTAMPYVPLPTDPHNLTEAEYAAERARIREEFFATYDVMTGVRIAATLGGFFGLMVFLIVWKSRSSSNETMKVLKDPKMAAVAAVCMQEEEEREIQEAIVATGMSIYPDEYDALVYRRQRMLSLGNVSAPPMLHRGYRCSSMVAGCTTGAGYSYLLEPPRRFSYSAISAGGGSSHIGVGRRKSGSESSRIFSNYPMGGSFGTDDYFVETEDEMDHEPYMQRDGTLQELDEEAQTHKRSDSTRSKQGFLSVPLAGHDSRRSSAMTCCSTDSSYLERRTSAYTLGMSNLPPTLQRKLSTASRTSSIENWDYYYPDIQVIQPTPKASPCPSERSIHEPASKSKVPAAPANASVGSCGLSAPTIVPKHSIVSYDPDSAQAGRKQQIHSISADTVDVYPYNQALVGAGSILDLGLPLPKPIQSAPPTSAHQQAFHFSDSPSDELRLGVRRKLTVVELQRSAAPAPESNNNSFPYTTNATTAAASATTATATATTATAMTMAANSSSISIDSTPMSMDKLNGSVSLGTVSAKALFNAEKRAPLASLSSFKISSLDYQDSELRSLDEDSVFGVESNADTDDDMQQLSSDSEEQALQAAAAATAAANAIVEKVTSADPQQKLPQQPVLAPLVLHHPSEKRLSLSTMPTGVRPRRPLLQRHRTISASSSDRIQLLGQPLHEFQSAGAANQALAVAPLETHFGAIICTGNSPPTSAQPRRAHLLQQYSDPQSLPTTTTTTTTTTTEEDTCSTLNTEVGLLDAVGGGSGGNPGGSGESATQTQYSSLNTVISLGRSSPLTDNNFLCSSGSATNVNNINNNNTQVPQPPIQTHATQLPLSKPAHDPCASSISDSVVTTRPQTICMPSSLKELILRGGGGPVGAQGFALSGVSRSATNLNVLCTATGSDEGRLVPTATPAVMLELPLIKLPTEEDDTDDDDRALEDGDHNDSDGLASQGNRSKSEESHDPSLPSTSRKWSKETLF